jgi:hypothetical protein
VPVIAPLTVSFRQQTKSQTYESSHEMRCLALETASTWLWNFF